ncbi:hypothetical protein LT493_24415 [Streptomyces tricolor]|nr:hypothetical protein [Streptomyces tricolor]
MDADRTPRRAQDARCTQRETAMSALALSVLLSVVSALAYAGGAIVQEQVAVSSPGQRVSPAAPARLVGCAGAQRSRRRAARRGRWRFGPLSLVQPLARADHRLRAAHGGAVRRPPGRCDRLARRPSPSTVGLAVLLALVGSSSRTRSTRRSGWRSRWSPAGR